MTISSHQTTLSTPFRSMRLPLRTLPVRLPRLERQGLSRRELRELVAEMLG